MSFKTKEGYKLLFGMMFMGIYLFWWMMGFWPMNSRVKPSQLFFLVALTVISSLAGLIAWRLKCWEQTDVDFESSFGFSSPSQPIWDSDELYQWQVIDLLCELRERTDEIGQAHYANLLQLAADYELVIVNDYCRLEPRLNALLDSSHFHQPFRPTPIPAGYL